MKKEVKSYSTNKECNGNEVSKLLMKKETTMALVMLDKELGVAPIMYDTTLNKTNCLALGASVLVCAYGYIYPSLLSVTSALLVCGMSSYLMKDKVSKTIRQNIANVCGSGQYCEYYELTYLKNLDKEKVNSAKQLLIDNGLLSKDANDVEFINLINNYTTRANYNNLLYYPLYLSINGKRIANKQQRQKSYYIQNRNLLLKKELIERLREM